MGCVLKRDDACGILVSSYNIFVVFPRHVTVAANSTECENNLPSYTSINTTWTFRRNI